LRLIEHDYSLCRGAGIAETFVTEVVNILNKGNGAQCIQKLNGSVLGWYRPSPSGGRTTDPNGRVIAQGNVLASLVVDLL
jgi:hypothetical protein